MRAEDADGLLREACTGRRPARLDALLEQAGAREDSTVLGSFLGGGFVQRFTSMRGTPIANSFRTTFRSSFSGRLGGGSQATSPASVQAGRRPARTNVDTIAESARSGRSSGRESKSTVRSKSGHPGSPARASTAPHSIASSSSRSSASSSSRRSDSTFYTQATSVGPSSFATGTTGQRPVRRTTGSSIVSAISSAISGRGRYGGPTAMTLGQRERQRTASYNPNSWAVPGTSWLASFRRFEKKPPLVPDRVALGLSEAGSPARTPERRKKRRGGRGSVAGGSSSDLSLSEADETVSTVTRATSILSVAKHEMRTRDEAIMREVGKQTRKRGSSVLRLARRAGALPPVQGEFPPWRRNRFLSPAEIERLEEERARSALFGGAQQAAAAAFGGEVPYSSFARGSVQRLYIPPLSGLSALAEQSGGEESGRTRGGLTGRGERPPLSARGSSGSGGGGSARDRPPSVRDGRPPSARAGAVSARSTPSPAAFKATDGGQSQPLSPTGSSPPPPPPPPAAWLDDTNSAAGVVDPSGISIDIKVKGKGRVADSQAWYVGPGQEALPPLIRGGVAPSRIPQIRRSASETRMQSIDELEEEQHQFQQQQQALRLRRLRQSSDDGSGAHHRGGDGHTPGEASEALSGIERGGESSHDSSHTSPPPAPRGARARTLSLPAAGDSGERVFMDRLLPEPPRARTLPASESRAAKRVVFKTPSETGSTGDLRQPGSAREGAASPPREAPAAPSSVGSPPRTAPSEASSPPRSPLLSPTVEGSDIEMHPLQPAPGRVRALLSEFLRMGGQVQPPPPGAAAAGAQAKGKQLAFTGEPAGESPDEGLRLAPAAAPAETSASTSASASASSSRPTSDRSAGSGSGGSGGEAAGPSVLPARPARPQAGILKPRSYILAAGGSMEPPPPPQQQDDRDRAMDEEEDVPPPPRPTDSP